MTKLIYAHWRWLSAGMLLLISLLSLLPLDQLPPAPGSDKTHHLLAYGLLALPIAVRAPKHWLYLLGACFLWSGALELIQPLVNRYGELLDLAANGAGLMIGAWVGRMGAKWGGVE